MDCMYSFSSGLGILQHYRQAYKCLVNVSDLVVRFQNLKAPSPKPANWDYYDHWLDEALAIGNISSLYKGCYDQTEGSIYALFYYILQY